MWGCAYSKSSPGEPAAPRSRAGILGLTGWGPLSWEAPASSGKVGVSNYLQEAWGHCPDLCLSLSGWRLGDSVHVLLGRHRLHWLPGCQGRSPGPCVILPLPGTPTRSWLEQVTFSCPLPVLWFICHGKGSSVHAQAWPQELSLVGFSSHPLSLPPSHSSSQQHVQDGRKENLEGFMKTFDKELPEDAHPGIYALDCEMVSRLADHRPLLRTHGPYRVQGSCCSVGLSQHLCLKRWASADFRIKSR